MNKMGKCCKKKRKRCKSWENHQKPYNGCGHQQTFNCCYNHQICHCCGCCFTPCPPIPPQPMCPPITFPNEPSECAPLRDNLDGSPFQAGNLEAVFFNNMATLNDLTGGVAGNSFNTLCQGDFAGDAHLPTVEELNLISGVFASSGGPCPTLLWANINGIPTLVYVVPGSPPIIVPSPPSLNCRAGTVCVHPAVT